MVVKGWGVLDEFQQLKMLDSKSVLHGQAARTRLVQ